jgi:hypothetical protein
MARWKRTDPSAVPEELARYVASEWPSDDPVGDWRAAALAWLREDPGRRLPLGQYGDSVDVIRESARIKLEQARRADKGDLVSAPGPSA